MSAPGQFRRDYRREARGRHGGTLDAALVPVLTALANDAPLETRHRDHALTGDWKGPGTATSGPIRC